MHGGAALARADGDVYSKIALQLLPLENSLLRSRNLSASYASIANAIFSSLNSCMYRVIRMERPYSGQLLWQFFTLGLYDFFGAFY